MPKYLYRAVDRMGKPINGTFEASDKASVLYMIKDRGLLPLDISEDNSLETLLKKLNTVKIPLADLSVFCRQFSTILNSGITILGAVEMLRRQTRNKRFRKILSEVYEELQKGHSLAQSMKTHGDAFPPLLTNMIDAGEVSGTLDITMQRLASHYEKENSINQKIKAAMSYPIVLLSMSIGMILFMVYGVLPNFMGMVDNGTEMPELTKIVIGATDLLRYQAHYVLIAIVLLAVVFKRITAKGKGKRAYHELLLKMPFLGQVIRKIVASKFSRTLGILLTSGLPLLSCLDATGKVVGNAVAEDGIKSAITALKNGQGLSAPLAASGVFDPIVVQMIQIGEDSGSLEDMLAKTADFFDEEVESGLSQLMNVIQPVMIVLMGVVIGIMVIAMLLPMYGMLENLGV